MTAFTLQGVCIVPGSHKANLKLPPGVKEWEKYKHLVTELHVRAPIAPPHSTTKRMWLNGDTVVGVLTTGQSWRCHNLL